MESPWLSVLMPTFNGSEYLPAAFSSIIDQGDKNIECVVVDDGSTDATLAIVESYAQKVKVRVVRMPWCGNWVAKTNKALFEAQGEFACILPQDDVWLPGRLVAVRSLLKRLPDANLVFHRSLYVNEKGDKLGVWRPPLPVLNGYLDRDLFMRRFLVQNSIALCAPVFRRKIALEVGGLSSEFWYGGDWDFWLKLGVFGKIAYIPKPLSGFRIHRRSLTVVNSSFEQDVRNQLETIVSRHLGFWQAPVGLKAVTKREAHFSNEINIALFSLMHKWPIDYFRLLRLFVCLGPRSQMRYLSYSRLFERVAARLGNV